MQRVENYLKLLLQGFGAVTAIALVPFVMPRSWMAMVHEWLGMGVLPDQPVVEYLARTTSALYGLLGGLYLVLATDVRRFARAITYSAVAALLISAVNTALCLRAGMPTWWMGRDLVVCWVF